MTCGVVEPGRKTTGPKEAPKAGAEHQAKTNQPETCADDADIRHIFERDIGSILRPDGAGL